MHVVSSNALPIEDTSCAYRFPFDSDQWAGYKARLKRNKAEGIKPVPSGIDALDAQLEGGIPSKAQTVLVAPAGAGKSTLGIRFAINWAKNHGWDPTTRTFSYAIFVSLEMSADNVRNRVVSIHTNTSWKDIDAGDCPWEVEETEKYVEGIPFMIYTRKELPTVTALDLLLNDIGKPEGGKSRPPLVVIDYVQQYAEMAPAEKQAEIMAETSAQLREICERHKCTILEVSRTARSYYNVLDKKNHRPILDEVLKMPGESSKLEFDADCVIGVCPIRAAGNDPVLTWLAVGKARKGGRVGSILTEYHGKGGRFNAVPRGQEAAYISRALEETRTGQRN